MGLHFFNMSELETYLPGIKPLKDEDDLGHIARYWLNIVFEDVLSVTKQTSFPGSMVVSLTRDKLELLQGQKMIHVPYKNQEIEAWLKPAPRTIPPLHLVPQKHQVDNVPTEDTVEKLECSLSELMIDFSRFEVSKPWYGLKDFIVKLT